MGVVLALMAGLVAQIVPLASLGNELSEMQLEGHQSIVLDDVSHISGTECTRMHVDAEDQWLIGGERTKRCDMCGSLDEVEKQDCQDRIMKDSLDEYHRVVEGMAKNNCWADGKTYAAAEPEKAECCRSSKDPNETCAVCQTVVFSSSLAAPSPMAIEL